MATTAHDFRPANAHDGAIRVETPDGHNTSMRLSPCDTAGDKVTRLARAYVPGTRFYLVRRGLADVEL